MWTRELIETMTEDDLCREVLVPLFTAMGFRDAQFVGGGILEQGKDIVMWRPEPPRDRVDYGVVAKKGKISGGTAIGTVLTQVKECLGRPYEDPMTTEPRRIGHCYVVASGEISKEGNYSLSSLFEQDRLTPLVTVIGMPRLWDLIQQHLPVRLAVDEIRRAYVALTPTDPTVAHDVTVKDGMTEIVLRPRNDAGGFTVPDVSFPDSTEGTAARRQFDEFLKTGRSIEIPGEFLAGFQLPSAVRDYFERIGTPSLIRLTRQRPREPMAFALKLTGSGGSIEFEHIDFTSVEGGTESVRFRNDEQMLPLRIDLTMLRSGEASLHFELQLVGESIEWVERALAFQRFASTGGELTLRHHRTLEVFRAVVMPLADVTADTDPRFLELVRRVVDLAHATHSVIRVPNREYFTAEDQFELERAEDIVRSGRLAIHGEVQGTFSLVEGTQHQLLRDGLEVSAQRPDWVADILGSLVDFGPHTLVGSGLCVHPADRERVSAELASGESLVSCRLVAGPDGQFEARFARFPKGERI